MKYKVISNTLSWVTKKSFKKGDIVEVSVYGKSKTAELVKRGFLEPVEEPKKKAIEDMKVDELKAKLIELGVESPEGKKAELIEQLKGLV